MLWCSFTTRLAEKQDTGYIKNKQKSYDRSLYGTAEVVRQIGNFACMLICIDL